MIARCEEDDTDAGQCLRPFARGDDKEARIGGRLTREWGEIERFTDSGDDVIQLGRMHPNAQFRSLSTLHSGQSITFTKNLDILLLYRVLVVEQSQRDMKFCSLNTTINADVIDMAQLSSLQQSEHDL